MDPYEYYNIECIEDYGATLEGKHSEQKLPVLFALRCSSSRVNVKGTKKQLIGERGHMPVRSASRGLVTRST